MANAFNSVHLVARIPSSEKLPMNFIEKDEPTKNFISFFVSTRRAFKPKDEQYYPEDLIQVKSFGHTATFVHNYIKKGDTIAIEGELRKDDDWKDKEGNQRHGELYVYAESIRSIGNSSSNKESSDSEETASATPKCSGSASALAARLRNRKNHI